MRSISLAVTLLVATNVFGTENVRQFEVVNAGANDIASVAVAQAGSGVFRTALDDHHHPILVKSGESITIPVRPGEGGCLRDLRVKFADGEILVEHQFDVCKNERFRAASPR